MIWWKVEKIVIAICFLMASTFSTAQDFKCEKNYPEYKKILDEEVTLLKKGDLNQLTQYYDKNNYSALFNHNHAEQRYKFYRWVDFEQYEAESAQFVNSLKEGEIQIGKFTLDKPISNLIISAGEICVFPITLELKISGEIDNANGMAIFVRRAKSNEWKIFNYNSRISEEDFNEFFPDFPKDVLSKMQSLE